MRNKTTQFFAFLALFGIIISVVWTGLVLLFWDSNPIEENIYIPENTKTEVTASWTNK